MPPGASGESQCTCARGPTSGVLPRSGILSAAPKHGILVPIADAFARILPCGAAWARTPHDTCSPTWSGIGSDKDPTLDPPSLVIKPREEDLTPGTVKPVQVSLVEPVAYQFQLRLKIHGMENLSHGIIAPKVHEGVQDSHAAAVKCWCFNRSSGPIV